MAKSSKSGGGKSSKGTYRSAVTGRFVTALTVRATRTRPSRNPASDPLIVFSRWAGAPAHGRPPTKLSFILIRGLHVLTHPCVQICDRVPNQLTALRIPGAIPGPAQRIQRGLRHLQVVRRPLRCYPPRGHEDSPPSSSASPRFMLHHP